jgi:hypothetical protein
MTLLKTRSVGVAAVSGGTIAFDNSTSVASVEPPASGWAASALESPNLSQGSIFASSARLAARLNATSISATEHEALLRERQFLLDKLFDGSITKSEQNQLEYVRWSLDRIEDARFGHSLDALENQVDTYENVIKELNKFYEQLETRTERRPRR